MINTYTIDKPNPPIALAATKIDLLKGDFSCLDSAQKIAKDKDWLFYKTSAKLNIGVNELFEGLICKHFQIPLSRPMGKLQEQSTMLEIGEGDYPVMPVIQPYEEEQTTLLDRKAVKPMKVNQVGEHSTGFLSKIVRFCC